jgi:hypothetical protein
MVLAEPGVGMACKYEEAKLVIKISAKKRPTPGSSGGKFDRASSIMAELFNREDKFDEPFQSTRPP